VTSNVRKEFEKNLETTSKQTKELESELKKLQTTSKGLGNKLEELEKKLESNFETTKKLDDKLEQLEEKLKSNFEKTSTQTKELNNKLDEILKLLKPEWESSIQLEPMNLGWISSTRLQHGFSYSEFIFIQISSLHHLEYEFQNYPWGVKRFPVCAIHLYIQENHFPCDCLRLNASDLIICDGPWERVKETMYEMY